MLDVKFEVRRKIDFVNIVLAKRRKRSFLFFFFTKNFLKILRIGNNRHNNRSDKGLSRTPLVLAVGWLELYGVLSRPWNLKIKFCHLPTALVVNFKSHLHRQLDIVHCSRTCDHAKIPFSLCISITWPAMEFFHLRFAS